MALSAGVAVVGASHSALLIVKNLLEAGASNVVNIYHQNPGFRYAQGSPPGYVRFPGSGLKGPVMEWVKQKLEGRCRSSGETVLPPGLSRVRYEPSKAWVEQLSELGCSHVVFAMGYRPSRLDLPALSHQCHCSGIPTDTDLALADLSHDPITGEIALPYVSCGLSVCPLPATEGNLGSGASSFHRGLLFGAGLCYPQDFTDSEGHVEPFVGFRRSIWQVDHFLEAAQTS